MDNLPINASSHDTQHDHNQFNHMGMEFFKDCQNCLGAEGNHACTDCKGLGIVEKTPQEIFDTNPSCTVACSPSDWSATGKCGTNGCYRK